MNTQSDATYRIFDSLDRPCSRPEPDDAYLFAQLEQLERDSETSGDRLTYAIGKITPDGAITFDF